MEEKPWGLVGWMVSVLGRRLAVEGWLEQAWTGVLVERSALVESKSWLGEEVVVDGEVSGGASSCCVSTGSLLPSRMVISEGQVLARWRLCGRLLSRNEWMSG